jgi:hypothetical protein
MLSHDISKAGFCRMAVNTYVLPGRACLAVPQRLPTDGRFGNIASERMRFRVLGLPNVITITYGQFR